jgi:uncharacterized protein
MKNHDTCILLFVKYPTKGQVKRRLATNLSEDIVIGLYRAFVKDTLATIQKIQTTPLICITPRNAQKKFQKWLGETYTFVPQTGKDLGERMKNSFNYAFQHGFHRAVLIGSDSPDLPKTFLHNAFTELQHHDVVLGPTADGGYYLIGFQDTTFEPSIFDGIHWSSSTVCQETIENIKRTNHCLSLLPMWSDVDTIDDLKNLLQRNKNTGFKSSDTITYIHQHNIQLEDNDVAASEKQG